jgi:hypothetical protein
MLLRAGTFFSGGEVRLEVVVVWLANYYFTHENTPLARLALEGALPYAFPL